MGYQVAQKSFSPFPDTFAAKSTAKTKTTKRKPNNMACKTCNGNKKITCPICNGSGKVNGKECHACGGDMKKICPTCQGTGK
jgi:DnaJ-class molecular chaperone